MSQVEAVHNLPPMYKVGVDGNWPPTRPHPHTHAGSRQPQSSCGEWWSTQWGPQSGVSPCPISTLRNANGAFYAN